MPDLLQLLNLILRDAVWGGGQEEQIAITINKPWLPTPIVLTRFPQSFFPLSKNKHFPSSLCPETSQPQLILRRKPPFILPGENGSQMARNSLNMSPNPPIRLSRSYFIEDALPPNKHNCLLVLRVHIFLETSLYWPFPLAYLLQALLYWIFSISSQTSNS